MPNPNLERLVLKLCSRELATIVRIFSGKGLHPDCHFSGPLFPLRIQPPSLATAKFESLVLLRNISAERVTPLCNSGTGRGLRTEFP